MTISTLTLVDLDRLYRGFQVITFEEFCGVLRETIGAQDDYASGCWPRFRADPANYCMARNPRSQGEALLTLAIKKAEEK